MVIRNWNYCGCGYSEFCLNNDFYLMFVYLKKSFERRFLVLGLVNYLVYVENIGD